MKINWKKVGTWCLMGILAVSALGGVGTAIWTQRELRAYKEKVAAEAVRTKPEVQPPKKVVITNGKCYRDSTGTLYFVTEEGDDLVSVAIKCGVAPSALMEENNLKVGEAIKKGDVLKVPANGQCSDAILVNRKLSPTRRVAEAKDAPSGGGLVVAKPPEPEPLRILGTEYDGEENMVICFSHPPDLESLKTYLDVGPTRRPYSIEYHKSSGWNCAVKKKDDYHFHVEITGDFLYRTNLALRVKAGCPVAKTVKDAAPLSSDFSLTFQRKDAPPRVSFADSGHYLPPGGARMLAIDSINVAKVRCAAAAIPPANIVQLLAREHEAYKNTSIYSSDDERVDTEATESLADRLVEWDVETMGRVNEHQASPFKLRTLPDAASNGVFLVAIRDATRERKDQRWYWDDQRGEKWNPNRYRVVCVTDVGLTVRREQKNLFVWATSLMQGSPVTNCTISVYGSNNRCLGTGRTDPTGLCKIVCTDRAEPFAVIARTADGMDTSFVCLRDHRQLDETPSDGEREDYLAPKDVQAYVWTERGIYRHDEPIFVHAILRNGKNEAPKPFPVEFELVDQDDNVVASKMAMTDRYGAAWCDGFTVSTERPSGAWTVRVGTPGKDGRILGYEKVSVEEFAPPQIRVSAGSTGTSTSNFAITVKAEHLYGGPARGLVSAGAVVFEDAPFAPKGWGGWCFGDERLGLNGNYRRLPKQILNADGKAVFPAPLWADTGTPKAAVRVLGEGTVFEDGGRPARARTTTLLHAYPFYIGTTLGGNLRLPKTGYPTIKLACVKPDGTRLSTVRKLSVAFERVESVYSCKEDRRGWLTWDCDRVYRPQASTIKEIETKAEGDVELTLPFDTMGDYRVILTDVEAKVSFAKTFWLGSRGDDTVRAPLANPSAVTLSFDKKFYRPGEVPRLLVKAPFAGWALLTVMREKVISTRVVKLAGATQELTLDPVTAEQAPNLNVSLCVVQSTDNGGWRQTARAHGEATLRVRPWENEVPVKVTTSYVPSVVGGKLTADVVAIGTGATGTVAVVTVVDEGIHLLTGWTPRRPVEFLAKARSEKLPLFDLFDNLLPVWDGDPTKVRGQKTGGDIGAGLLGRVSPTPTRRFKTLARWQVAVPLTNGVGRAVFTLPEFVGEVRVAAVAYSEKAVGATDCLQKVCPKLVLQGDAPRFAAPGDVFDATITLDNRSGNAGSATWSLVATGAVTCVAQADATKKVEALAKDGSATRHVRLQAGSVPGQGFLTFTVEGFGETHVQTIELPVRPAVASRLTAGTIRLEPGEKKVFAPQGTNTVAEATVRWFKPSGSELAKLLGALDYLADYPHGCLEQTTSRIFPLVASDGFLNRLASSAMEGNLATNRAAYIAAGVERVTSMIRMTDFVMWPDCNYPPWNREVSLYAIHFLIAAEKSGVKLHPFARKKVVEFLHKWTGEGSQNAAYACHTLALAGEPDKDCMLLLYDRRSTLDLLARTRLARAFVTIGDRMRAGELLVHAESSTMTLKSQAFLILALLDLDPNDPRLGPLVRKLEATRDAARYSWGTTESNAHALLALGAYYRYHPTTEGEPHLTIQQEGSTARPLESKKSAIVRGAAPVTVANVGQGTAWLAWRTQELPTPAAVTNESNQIAIERAYFTPEAKPADLTKLQRGDLLIVQLTVKVPEGRAFNDLVIQDLFPAACEPVLGKLDTKLYPWVERETGSWVMRSDTRDDRILLFSKKFMVQHRKAYQYLYPLRVVSPGTFTVPGLSIEAMYAPEIHAVTAPTRVTVSSGN